MTRALIVERPGLFSTVQDMGRTGYADAGLTPSGALDPIGLRLANALVGNAQDEPCLEVLHSGPTVKVDSEMVRIAAVGGQARGTIRFADGTNQSLPTNRSITLARGDTVSIDGIDGSAVCTVAVGGGFDLPSVLGSCATYAKAQMGGLEGRPLTAGDVLPLRVDSVDGPDKSLPGDPERLYGNGAIRVVMGPQDDAFDAPAIETFLTSEFTVGRNSDRMGLRLEGPELPHRDAYEIPSDGIAPGSIQVPGTKQPIILLAERGTVGGYTKIATVASVDLPRLGRVQPEDGLQFTAIDRDEAEALRRRQEAAIVAMIGDLRDARSVGTPDYDLLGGVNLISGIWGSDGSEQR